MSFFREISKAYHSITGTPTSAEKRATKQALDTQSEYYNTAQKEMERVAGELKSAQDNERKRKNEKLLRNIGANKRPMMKAAAPSSMGSDNGLSGITG